ncbi:MAG: PDZ domain-containing protein, partial [Chrysiogenetes bacterium]|nr:PDZ domain-containing protein [Chrysiogenetes bacterium]
FEPEDVIVEYEGKPVRELSDLPRLVAGSEVGKRVDVVVLRKGKRKELRPRIARLEEAGPMAAAPQSSEPAPAHQDAARKFGMELKTLTPELARREGLTRSEGVLITRVMPQSPAAQAALAPGDIIIEVEHERVRSVEDFATQSRNAREERLLLRVVRGDRYLFAVLRP